MYVSVSTRVEEETTTSEWSVAADSEDFYGQRHQLRRTGDVGASYLTECLNPATGRIHTV